MMQQEQQVDNNNNNNSNKGDDRLDKLEFIIESMIKDKNKEIECSQSEKGIPPSNVYLYGIRSQIGAFENILSVVRAMKDNSPNIDALVRMYKEEEEEESNSPCS